MLCIIIAVVLFAIGYFRVVRGTRGMLKELEQRLQSKTHKLSVVTTIIHPAKDAEPEKILEKKVSREAPPEKTPPVEALTEKAPREKKRSISDSAKIMLQEIFKDGKIPKRSPKVIEKTDNLPAADEEKKTVTFPPKQTKSIRELTPETKESKLKLPVEEPPQYSGIKRHEKQEIKSYPPENPLFTPTAKLSSQSYETKPTTNMYEENYMPLPTLPIHIPDTQQSDILTPLKEPEYIKEKPAISEETTLSDTKSELQKPDTQDKETVQQKKRIPPIDTVSSLVTNQPLPPVVKIRQRENKSIEYVTVDEILKRFKKKLERWL